MTLKQAISLVILLQMAVVSRSQDPRKDEDSIQINSIHRSSTLRNFIIPTSLIGLGIYGTIDSHIINVKEIREERTEYFPGFSHKADNYLQFAPIPAVFLMDAFGLKGVHSWQDQLVYLGQSELIMMGMVYPLKTLTRVERPDNSSNNSFPSGHTAQAFMAAHFFYKEFGKKYPLASAGMYTLAAGIGTFRVLNNRHWASDVLAGAGIGMASVELSYLIGAHHAHSSHFHPVIMPTFSKGAIGCSMVVGL